MCFYCHSFLDFFIFFRFLVKAFDAEPCEEDWVPPASQLTLETNSNCGIRCGYEAWGATDPCLKGLVHVVMLVHLTIWLPKKLIVQLVGWCFFSSQECGKGKGGNGGKGGKGKGHDNARHPRLQNAGARLLRDGIALQMDHCHSLCRELCTEGDTAVLIGQVKSFDESKNYGFIACDLVSSVYFGHSHYEVVFVILDILC